MPQLSVRIEAIAALANLAVNDANELEIVSVGGLEPIVQVTWEQGWASLTEYRPWTIHS